MSPTATLVRHNDQLENRDIEQINSVVFDLASSSGWAEIPTGIVLQSPSAQTQRKPDTTPHCSP